MGWHKSYNVSGTVDVGDRLDTLVAVLRSLLGPDSVGIIGHFTGATTVGAQSDRALFITTGFASREFFAHVTGDRQAWLACAHEFELSLQLAGLPFSIVVHDHTINAEPAGSA